MRQNLFKALVPSQVLAPMGFTLCHKICTKLFTSFCSSESTSINLYIPQGLRVTGISKEKPARQCGLQFDDVIQLFAVATIKTVGGLHSCLQTCDFFKKSLSDAATNGWSFVLAIRRQPGTLI